MRGIGCLAVLGILAASPAGARDMLGIYGAWVMEGEECRRIFATDNGRVVFGASRREPLPAFIVNQEGISNNEYLCSVREYTVRRDVTTFTGRCEIGRRKSRQRFTIRDFNGVYQVQVGRDFVPIRRCEVGDLRDLATVRAERERFERENATPLARSVGLWASNRDLCPRAFDREPDGRVTVRPTLAEDEVALVITDGGILSRGSDCALQRVEADRPGEPSYRAALLCSADGREFATTERIVVLDPDTIERTPAARQPVPQRLVRCPESEEPRGVRRRPAAATVEEPARRETGAAKETGAAAREAGPTIKETGVPAREAGPTAKETGAPARAAVSAPAPDPEIARPNGAPGPASAPAPRPASGGYRNPDQP